jgi:hypothetical protein
VPCVGGQRDDGAAAFSPSCGGHGRTRHEAVVRPARRGMFEHPYDCARIRRPRDGECARTPCLLRADAEASPQLLRAAVPVKVCCLGWRSGCFQVGAGPSGCRASRTATDGAGLRRPARADLLRHAPGLVIAALTLPLVWKFRRNRKAVFVGTVSHARLHSPLWLMEGWRTGSVSPRSARPARGALERRACSHRCLRRSPQRHSA